MDVNGTVSSGRLKRFIEFDFRKAEDVRRYNFSKSINFTQFIKDSLDEEMVRQEMQMGPSSITVKVGE